VESAQFKEQGYQSNLDFGKIVTNLIPELTAGTISFLAGCGDYIMDGSESQCLATYSTGIAKSGKHPVICGSLGAAKATLEIVEAFNSQFSFNNYDAELKGKDYCENEE
jgi:hypothetical protein